jgi:hypothetical protein
MKDKIMALALLSGIEPNEVHELPNGYWPESYVEERKVDPWFLFVCDGGTFTIGWRKRVLSVTWTQADANPITEESEQWITHGPRYFHAYDWIQAVRYLSHVVGQLDKKPNEDS